MPTPKVSNEIIHAAILGFEEQKRRIDGEIASLRAMLGSGSPSAEAPEERTPTGRRKFSAAARKRMKEAQQRRWAAIRGDAEPAAAKPGKGKPKRKLSAAGRAAIIAATKARWARIKESGKPAGAKKSGPAKKKTATKKAATPSGETAA